MACAWRKGHCISPALLSLYEPLTAIESGRGVAFLLEPVRGGKGSGGGIFAGTGADPTFKGNVPPSILALRRRERALGTLHVEILGVKDGKIFDKVKFSKDFARKNTACGLVSRGNVT